MRGIGAGVSQNFGRKSEKAESFDFMRGEQKITPDLLWRKDIPCNFGSKCRLRKSKLNKLKTPKIDLESMMKAKQSICVQLYSLGKKLPEKILAFILQKNMPKN